MVKEENRDKPVAWRNQQMLGAMGQMMTMMPHFTQGDSFYLLPVASPMGRQANIPAMPPYGAPQNQWPHVYAKCTGDMLTKQQKFVLANYL